MEQLIRSLSDLGYVKGQNVVFEWRFTKGKLDRFPEFAAELVRLNVDCIVAVGVAATRARPALQKRRPERYRSSWPMPMTTLSGKAWSPVCRAPVEM
jgi:hypothetical protein